MSSKEILIVLFHDVGEIEESMRLDLKELHDLLDDDVLKKKIKIIMESEERHKLLVEEGQTILNENRP